MDFYDLIDPVELTGVARQVVADEDQEMNTFQLRRWFPAVNVDSIEFEWDAGTTRSYTDSMPFRTWTTEAPLGNRPGRIRKSGEMPPLSLKFMLTELDRIRQRQALRGGGLAADAVQGDVFGDIERGIKAMLNRMEIAAADAVVNGSTVLAENGLALTVDFGRDAAREDTVANAWSSAGTATPLSDEAAVVEVMEDNEGLSADDLVAVMNRDTWKDWKAADQVRNSLNTVRVLDDIPISGVNEIRRGQELPDVALYNAKTNGVDGTNRKIIPDGMVVYLPKNAPVGQTQFGVPAVADEPEVALEADQRPGPVAYMMRQLDPLIVYTVVDAIGFPVFGDVDRTYALDVAP